MLHFAYGSNMSRAVMRRHAPNAQAVGVAALAGYRFVVTADGYASVEPARARVVYGVLWRLTPRDRVTLDLWENVAGGLYHPKMLPVQRDGCRRPALVYVARPSGEGRPKPGYIEIVQAAGREWDLPGGYLRALEQWAPVRWLNGRTSKLGEFT